MEKLANQIETQLKGQEVCAVYNSELARVFPSTISPAQRKALIKQFADQHNLNVTFYDVGLCAVFERPNRKRGERDLVPPLPKSLKRGRRLRHR